MRHPKPSIPSLVLSLALAVAAALLLSACGGGSSGSTATAARLTRAQLIRRADAICRKGDEAINAEAEEFATEQGIDISHPSTAQQEEVVREVVGPGVRAQAEQIAELGAPEAAEEEVEAIVEAVRAGAEEAEANPSSVVESNLAHGAFEEASELAAKFGFKVCGNEQ